MGWIEKYGSGIRRILEEFKAYGLKSPTLQNISDGFMVTVFAESVEKNVEKGSERIVETLKDFPDVTQKELEKITGLTRRGVERNIRKLREEGVIERIGSDKGGYWKVLK